jgi:hypothetical protein
MVYKGMAHAWLRNLGTLGENRSWTARPRRPDPPDVQQKELKEVKCPSCNEEQSTKNHKLKGHAGHSQLKYQECNEVASTYEWLCACGIQWHKCGEHVHEYKHDEFQTQQFDARMFSKFSARGRKRKLPEHGIDQPMPRRKGNEAMHFEGIEHVQNRPFLKPGSKLASRFPRHVKLKA